MWRENRSKNKKYFQHSKRVTKRHQETIEVQGNNGKQYMETNGKRTEGEHYLQRSGRNRGSLEGHWHVLTMWTIENYEVPDQERNGREIQTAGLRGKRNQEVGTLDRDFLKEV